MKQTSLSYFELPLKWKDVLKKWVHRIGRKNLSINKETCVCSEHFVNAARRLLRIAEVPSLKLFFFKLNTNRRKLPKVRHCLTNDLVTVSPGTSCSAVTF